MRTLVLVLFLAPAAVLAQAELVIGYCQGGGAAAAAALPPSQPAPMVTTSAASSVTATSATLNGSANPNGSATTGWFRYATTNPGTCNNTFGTRAPSSGGSSLGSGSSAAAYSQALTGLQPETTYYACAVAQNAGGTRTGAVQTFTTLAEGGLVANGAVLVEPYLYEAGEEPWQDVYAPFVATSLAGLGDQLTIGYLYQRVDGTGGTVGGLGDLGVTPSRFAFALQNFLGGGWDAYPPGQEQVMLTATWPGTPLDDYTWGFIRLDLSGDEGTMKLDIIPPGMAAVSSALELVPTTGYPRSLWVWLTNPSQRQYAPNAMHYAEMVIWQGWHTDAEIAAQGGVRVPVLSPAYRMDLRPGTFGQDLSGNGRHGVVTGTPPAQSPYIPSHPNTVP